MRVQASQYLMKQEDEIAIVGVGCRFPGADDVDEFWRVLFKGENHLKEIPKDRWDLDDVYDKDPNASRKTNVRHAGFVKDYKEWDHKLFGINEMEAGEIDPQQRMVLDCVHMALEDGGIRRQDIDGSYTGVYIGSMNDDFNIQVMIVPEFMCSTVLKPKSDADEGSMNDDFKIQAMMVPETFGAYTVTGLHNSIISARVAYVYNLHGAAVTMDTACSSSMVAINVAEQALRLGTCDAAICGGVNSIMDAVNFVALSKARMLSPTGQSKPFSADADGYARGEGCGIVILKRLQEAIKDGNKIWGTLRSGSNQDGNTATPITAPSGTMQLDLLKRLYTVSNVDKHSVQVIEAHGTGTPVGDPIETNALGKFFSKNGRSGKKTLIGSVKSNIGHTEAAAGVAGLTKVLLMMKYGQVVPTLLDKTRVNPKINFDQYSFDVPTEVTPWERPSQGGRIACVNSFGFGGTNCHAIVHEHVHPSNNKSTKEQQTSPCPYFVTLTALDESSLIDQVGEFTQRLKEKDYEMQALSYTSTCRRDHSLYRKAFAIANQQELIEACEQFVEKPPKQTQFRKAKIVFVFCGVGTTWKGMCAFMMQLGAFRDAIKSIDEHLLPLSGWTLSSKFSDGCDVTADPLVSHVTIFGCQVGLVEVWKSFGITPDLVVGQSVGEVAAAYTSGSIDLKSAVRVIYYRSKFLSEVKNGAMAVVKNVDTNTIEELCATTNGKLCIAVYNSPTSCTISGEKPLIDMVRTKLTNGLGAQGGVLIDLDVTCAYHSSFVENAAKEATKMLKNLAPGKQGIPIISTVSGKQEQHDIFAHESYWEKNTRCAVRFGDAILHAAEKSDSQETVFIEIGPGPVLGAHVKNLFQDETQYIVLPSMRRGSEKPSFCKTICTLYEIGRNLKWQQLVHSTGTVTEIPKYVFRKQSTPYRTIQMLENNKTSADERRDHLYVQRDTTAKDRNTLYLHISPTSAAFVFDHVVRGAVLIPGAFYADVGFEAARANLGVSPQEAIVSMEFVKTAKIEPNSQTVLGVNIVQISQTEIHFFVKHEKNLVCIGKVEKNKHFHEHAKIKGMADLLGVNQNIVKDEDLDQTYDIQHVRLSVMKDQKHCMDSKEIYRKLNEMGFQYGNWFQILKECQAGERHCLVRFSIPSDVFKDIGRTAIHPCLLDGMLQSTLLATDEKTIAIAMQEKLLLMPVAIENITVHSKPKSVTVYSYVKMTNATILPNVLKLHYDIVLLNADGTLIVDVKNYTTYSRRNTTFTPDELKYKLAWSPVSLKPAKLTNPKFLIINTTEHQEKRFDIAGEDAAICELQRSNLTEDMLHYFLESTVQRKWGKFDELEATVIFFCENEGKSDITATSRDEIYAHAKQNCVILTWLLRFFLNKKQTPLFIITENTQAVLGKDQSCVNFSGSEVWGFIRNVLIEFVHDKVVLVDLQPTFEETKTTLVNFLASAVKNIEATQTEYIVSRQEILGVSFSKTSMTEVMPNMRRSVRRDLKSSRVVMSEEEKSITRPFICPLSDKQQNSSSQKGFVELELTSVFLHKGTLFPVTAPLSLSDRLHSDIVGGNAMLAVEYTGIEIRSNSRPQLFRCGDKSEIGDEVLSSDRWQVVAVYPQQVKTRMAVPHDCMVSLRELPFYKPGMLTRAIQFWHMSQKIRKGSKVKIVSGGDVDDTFDWLLKRMLKTISSVKIVDEVSTSTDVMVLVDKFDEKMLDDMKYSKTIVCMKYAIPDTVQKHLGECKNVRIIDIVFKYELRREAVSKALKKVVPWLKRNITGKDMGRTRTHSDNSVAISRNELQQLPLKLPLANLFGEQDVFVITGGLTGLGWQTTLMLVEKGVGTVATMSRREIDAETKLKIRQTEQTYGCKIMCYRGDICNFQAVESMIDDLTTQYGSDRIRGVVHGAGVLDSQLLVNLDEPNFDRVMAPKVLGIMNLHLATSKLNLDFFILQSSIASVVGMPGQGSYGAANVFLDAFARWRRSRGLAAQSINWGALEVGMAARKQFVSNFVKRGYNLLSIAEIRDCFFQVIMQNSTEAVYANLDWSIIARDFLPPQMTRVAVSMKGVLRRKNIEHAPQQNIGRKEDFNVDALKNADNAIRLKSVEKFIEYVARKALGSDVGRIKMTTSFAELGMESLAVVTFSNVVYQETGYRIPEGKLLEKSLGDVVADVCMHAFDCVVAKM